MNTAAKAHDRRPNRTAENNGSNAVRGARPNTLETPILLLSSIEETASRTRKIPSATRVKVRLSDVVAARRNTLKYTKTIKTGKPQRPLSQSLFGERLAGKETRLLSALSHVNMKASLAAIACVLVLCLQALLVQEIDAQGGRGGFVEGTRGDRGLRVVREANRPPPGRRAAGVDFSDLSPGEVEKPDPDLLPGVRPRSDRRPRNVREARFESRKNGGTHGRRSADGLPDISLLPGEAEIPDPDLLPGVRPRSDRRPRDVRAEKFESRQNGVTHGRRSSDGFSDRPPGEAESPDLLPGVRQRGKNEKGPPNPGNH